MRDKYYVRSIILKKKIKLKKKRREKQFYKIYFKFLVSQLKINFIISMYIIQHL